MAKKRKAAGPVIGLDIGSRWIKAVEVRPGKAGPSVTGIGYEPTPQGAIVDDVILDTAAVSEAIKRLFSGGGISGKNVISSVAGQSTVVVRIIEVPKMTREELRETMKWEVERHIPFPSSEVVMDFQPLSRPSPSGDDQTMEVLLAVCQEDVVKKHMDTVLGAKLKPMAIEVEPLALPRSLVCGVPGMEDKRTVAIADIGWQTTQVCIYENLELVFPRSIPIGGQSLARAISEALSVDEDTADQMLREQGSVDLEALEALSRPAPAPEEETQIGGASPFAAAGFESPFAIPEPSVEEPPAVEAPGVPPPIGFDLGEEFVPAAPQAPFSLDEEEEAPAPKSIFDLDEPIGGEEEPSEPVFDLEEVEPEPAAAVEPALQATGDRSAAVGAAIAPVLVDLASELSRSLDYYASRNPAPAEVLLLCGGVAKLPGLAGYLEQALGMPVMVGDPLGHLKLASKRYSPEFLAEIAPVFSICVGLALRDFVGGEA